MEETAFRNQLNCELNKVTPEITVEGTCVYCNKTCVLTLTPVVTEIYLDISGKRKAIKLHMLGDEMDAKLLDITRWPSQNVIKELLD